MADPNRFKSDDDILGDEITRVKDHLMEVFYSALKSHGIQLNSSKEDVIGEWVCEELEKRGPLSE